MPDVFVSLDTSENSTYFSALIRGGHVNNFAFNYIKANRTALKTQYPNFSSFQQNFVCDQAFMDQFFEHVAREDSSLVFVPEDYRISEELIKLRLKAVIAQDLWSTNEMFQIYNETNEILQEAIQVLKNHTYYNYQLDK